MLGGFQPIDSKDETAYLALRYNQVTRIDTAGGSTTFTTSNSDWEYSATHEGMIVEQALAAYAIFQTTSASVGTPYLAFERNPL